MMRISPTSLYKQNLAAKLAKKGFDCFQALKDKIPAQQTRGNFKLGLYHSIGHTYFGFTGHTKGKDKGKTAAKLLNWAKEHSKAYLLTTKTLLPAEWQQDMDSREEPNRFVHSVFKRQAKLLSPWWTTVTFFDSFTDQVHMDILDHQTILLIQLWSTLLSDST